MTLIILFFKTLTCFFLGAIFGNIATTFFFRIPRGIPINGIERPPMCSSCGIRLKYPYYAPFFQFLFKGLKCHTCGAKLPIIYTLIEFLAGLFCLLFFIFYPVDSYFIIKFLAILVVLLSMLLFSQRGLFYDKLNWILLTISLLSLHYQSGQKDILHVLITERIINGLLFALLFVVITKSKNIQEICFFICISIFIPPVLFWQAGILSLIILFLPYINGLKFFLVPFLIASLL